MGLLNSKDGGYIKFAGKTYAINLERFKTVCTPKTMELGTREYEISQMYETNAEGELGLQSKIEHETKGMGNPQNDMIVYDVVKMLLLAILENDKPPKEFTFDLGTSVAINTLLYWGVLEEIDNK